MQTPLLLAIAGAGAVGAVSRYLVGVAVAGLAPGWPLATLAANVLGCFGFGLCWSLGHGRWPAVTEVAVLVGFFGAFTTFSSFAFDCHALWEEDRIGAMFLNLALQNGLGLLGMWGGVTAGRSLVA